MLGALVVSSTAVWTYASALHEVYVRDRSSIIATSYGGHLQFLTILSLALSLLHQLLAVFSQLTRLRSLNALQSWVLMVTAPLEVVVAILYWPLKLYNNDLVKDPRFGLKIDPQLDRKCHLYPAILELLSATVFAQRKWRSGLVAPLALFIAIAGAYWSWAEHANSINGFYPYPLLGILEFHQKAILIGGAAFVAFLVFKVIQSVQKRTNTV